VLIPDQALSHRTRLRDLIPFDRDEGSKVSDSWARMSKGNI
jgi:hypothetical protein